MAGGKYYEYEPSVVAAAIFSALFAVSTIFHLYQMIRTKNWYFTAFIVGGVFEIVGFGARALNAKQDEADRRGLYIIQQLGILLAPAFFAASIYMGFGRIILLADGEKVAIIKKKWLTKFFVFGDVLSFLAQAGGGVILAAENKNTAATGKAVMNVGLGIQIIFFVFFLINIYIFWRRVVASPTDASLSTPWKKHSKVLLYAGFVVLVRCLFRLIEYIQGKTGALMSNEIYMYVFDAGLMLVVMTIFNYWHPSEVGSLLKGGKMAKGWRIKDIDTRAERVRSSDLELNGGMVRVQGK